VVTMRTGTKTMKGQGTVTNLLALIITLIMYCVLIPVINPMIDDTATYLGAHPNDMTDATIMLLRLIPFVFILMIVLTAVNYGAPRREGYQQY